MIRITIAKTGETYEAAAGDSFLDFCRASGAAHEFGCTVGSCGTCVCLVDGAAGSVEPASDDELETVDMCSDVPGARLGCQLVLRGDVTIRQL